MNERRRARRHGEPPLGPSGPRSRLWVSADGGAGIQGEEPSLFFPWTSSSCSRPAQLRAGPREDTALAWTPRGRDPDLEWREPVSGYASGIRRNPKEGRRSARFKWRVW